MDEELNAMGRWYRLTRTCDCGSDRPFTHWVKDEEGNPLFKVCERCEERKMKSLPRRNSQGEEPTT